MTQDEVTQRLSAAGINLPAAEQAEIGRAYAMLSPMLALIRTPPLPPEAEPATTFAAGA